MTAPRAQRAPVLSAGMSARLAPTPLLDHKLRRWLAGQPLAMRQGFWVAIMLADGQIEHSQLPATNGDADGAPAYAHRICIECEKPITRLPQIHESCKGARERRLANDERANRKNEERLNRAREVVANQSGPVARASGTRSPR